MEYSEDNIEALKLDEWFRRTLKRIEIDPIYVIIGSAVGNKDTKTSELVFPIAYKADLVIKFLRNFNCFGDKSFQVECSTYGYAKALIPETSTLWEHSTDFFNRIQTT